MMTVHPRSVSRSILAGVLVALMWGCSEQLSTPPIDASAPVSEDGGNGPVRCEDGAWDNGGCIAWSTCAAGSYVTSMPSATTDRTCAACPNGRFSTTTNASSCTRWTTCEPGSHVTKPGSAILDQVCANCPEGTYSDAPNQATCIDADACPAGTEQTAPATGTTTPVCVACEIGTHCAGGEMPKEECATGTWDHDGNAATACVAWTDCVAGQAVAVDGTSTADRTCTDCPNEHFSMEINAATCMPWTTCTPGHYVSGAGSAVANRACTACPEGQTSTTTNAMTCVDVVAPADPVGLIAGETHTCARLADGSARCWGFNSSGQVGDGTTTFSISIPTAIPGLSGVLDLVAGLGPYLRAPHRRHGPLLGQQQLRPTRRRNDGEKAHPHPRA